jgi:hypothetical protein
MKAFVSYLKWIFGTEVDYGDDEALRLKIKELEKENRILREKLVYCGPFVF